MEITLTELCQDLRNWFDRERYVGKITLGANGGVFCNGVSIGLLENQYYRVIGSVLSDGVHKYPDAETTAESFDGAIWALSVPAPVVQLASDIEAWRAKYEAVDSEAMSPFTSETVGSHSYSKGSTSAKGESSTASWQSAFASRLNPWRKILPV